MEATVSQFSTELQGSDTQRSHLGARPSLASGFKHSPFQSYLQPGKGTFLIVTESIRNPYWGLSHFVIYISILNYVRSKFGPYNSINA